MKNDCRFCNGEVIEGEVLGRNMNMRMMINNLQNMFGFEPDKQERCENGPFCGRELEYES